MTSPADRLSAALSGRYRIERELGAGGMATVYLAHDEKHDRKVAIKVLKPELAAVLGADRFVVEIKTTAAMSHPHILPLFDSGTVDGFLFYVMPYIHGETIREKLNRETQFGVDEAIRIAREVADALDYAHRHGVIHRDIKPENILLHDGRAMVMDFGIALAVSAAAGGRMTETGLSLGTPHYMSPEQATAEKEITPRSDVYSLASVLYEMLAGQPPHVGGAAQQVIMKIITDTARPVNELRKNVPPNVVVALAKSLEKLPADRFDSAKAFGDALANAHFTDGTVGVVAQLGQSSGRGLTMAFGAVAAVATLVAAWALLKSPKAPDDPVLRVAIELPPGERIYTAPSTNIAISPDGERIAYASQRAQTVHTMMRDLSGLAAQEISATSLTDLAFSPDGKWLAYADGNAIKKTSVQGGPSISVGPLGEASARGMTWKGMDTIVVGATNGGLRVIPAGGGTLSSLAKGAGGQNAAFPVTLPDGKSIAFASGVNTQRRLAITALDSRGVTVLDIQALAPVGMRDGQLLYVATTGALMAVPFDLDRRRVLGTPVQVVEGVRQASTGAALAVLSASGTLWYVSGEVTSKLVLASTQGDDPVRQEARNFRNPRVSPDGRKIAVTVITGEGSDIYVYDRGDHTLARLTTDGVNGVPEWSPDSKRVLFKSTQDARTPIRWRLADGSGPPELLFDPPEPVNEALLSPDGQWLIYRTAPNAVHVRDIFAVPLTGDRKPVLIEGGQTTQESHPRLSPDGRWLAYASNESGRLEIFVRPFPGAGSKRQISVDGGIEPIWSRSGRQLFYRAAGGIIAASVTTGSTFTLGDRKVVLSGDYAEDLTHANFDVMPDGNHFVALKASGGESNGILVHNWGRELREKLGLGKK